MSGSVVNVMPNESISATITPSLQVIVVFRGPVFFYILMFILNDKVRKRRKQRKKHVYTPCHPQAQKLSSLFSCGTFSEATFVFHGVWDFSGQGQGLNISGASIRFLYYCSMKEIVEIWNILLFFDPHTLKEQLTAGKKELRIVWPFSEMISLPFLLAWVYFSRHKYNCINFDFELKL